MVSELLFGPKNITQSLRFSLGMVTEFTSRPPWRLHGVHRHRQFQVHPWNWKKKRHTKASQIFFYSRSYSEQRLQECVVTVLTICLFSGLHSSLLRSDNKVCADTNLCWRYACFSSTSEGIGNIISVNKLGGLPDLLCQPCQREMNA